MGLNYPRYGLMNVFSLKLLYLYYMKEIFINKANLKHNNKYDYSLVTYNKAKDIINIICLKHGTFKQRADHHLNGSGCPKCVGKNKIVSELINEFKLIHLDKYDYSLVDYKNAKTKIKIICPSHGNFELYTRQHLKGVNCSNCERERISVNQRKTTNQFIHQAIITHNDTYDYSLVDYTIATKPVKIICNKHGIFSQIPRIHINGAGCPICKESKGERKIRQLLESKDIKFIKQHTFPDCKNIRPLPFDFFLPDYNLCIEYQGEQHYLNKKFFGGIQKLEYIKNNDNIKLNYCISNNIKICIISYKDYDNIIKILQNYMSI